jgi:hypothetical protein
MSDSYTWSEAERVVGQKTSPRVCNMRDQIQSFLTKDESENGFVRAVRGSCVVRVALSPISQSA